MPLVSVLVPVYNDAAFLGQALSSIAMQTFNDYEVIVCDDASDDGSISIANEWAAKDARFKVVANGANLGMTKNWNRALSHAGGRYITKLDADDVMQSHCLEVLVGEMENAEGPYVAYCRTISCDAELNPFASYRGDRAFILAGLDPLTRQVLNGHDFYRMSFQDIQLWHSNAAIYRRDDLLKLGGWDTTWGCAADTDIILRILEQGRPICHSPYAGIQYRHRDESISGNFRKNGWLKWEGIPIHLLSLTRYNETGNSISTPLRKAWWRLWKNWQALIETGEYLQFPEPQKSNIASAASRISPPPARIVSEGYVRQKLWFAKRLLS